MICMTIYWHIWPLKSGLHTRQGSQHDIFDVQMTQNDQNMPKMIKWPILTACRDFYSILIIFMTIYEHIRQL